MSQEGKPIPSGTVLTLVLYKAKADDSPHQDTLAGANGRRSAIILKGQAETLTFNEPGSYAYICGLHPKMKGTIEVK